LLFAVLGLAIFVPVVSFGEAESIDVARLSLPDLFAGHYVLLTFLVSWWLLLEDRPPLPRFLHFGTLTWEERIRYGVGAGLAGWLLAVTLNLTIGGLMAQSEAIDATPRIPEIVAWFASLSVTSKLVVIGMAMTVEEAFFRGFLQPRLGPWVTSVLFALGHFSYGLPFLVVGVFTISLILGRTFDRTRDLIPCMIGHGVFDAIQLFVVLPVAIRSTAVA
jgi:membrane protease YdiL (CAAX protease family)